MESKEDKLKRLQEELKQVKEEIQQDKAKSKEELLLELSSVIHQQAIINCRYKEIKAALRHVCDHPDWKYTEEYKLVQWGEPTEYEPAEITCTTCDLVVTDSDYYNPLHYMIDVVRRNQNNP